VESARAGRAAAGAAGPWPSLLLNAVCPWVTYQVLTAQGVAALPALAATAAFPIAGVALGWVRARRLDALGGLSLLLIAVSLAVAFATENPLFVLVRGSIGNTVFGLLCFGSLVVGRPLMFYVARQFMAGWDAAAAARFEAQWREPAARRAFRTITLVWGVWLFALAAARVAAAVLLPISTFLALWPIVSTGGTFAMIYWSMAYGQRSARWSALLASAPAGRLDESARRALEGAREEARRRGHGYVGTEHLLLAVVADEGCAGARVLAGLGVIPAAVRAALEPTMPAGSAATAGETTYAPRLREVLDRAAEAAGDGPVGTEHLLDGLAAVEDGMAARGLVQAGVDLARLRERAAEQGGPPPGGPGR
jgi:hypothetical protein